MIETFGVALVIVLIGGALLESAHKWVTHETPIEREHRLFREGEIDLAELELRLDVHLDPEAERIREWAERRSGIGEATSFGIAARFDTLDDARSASREELEEIPNIGEKRAGALLEER